MTKQRSRGAKSSKIDEWVKRPHPTQTVSEIMREVDIKSMTGLLDNLLVYMPVCFKQRLKYQRYLSIPINSKYHIDIHYSG